jgi:hypothetical protein
MLEVRLVHPLEPDRVHQLYDALEICAHLHGQSIELRLHLGVKKTNDHVTV